MTRGFAANTMTVEAVLREHPREHAARLQSLGVSKMDFSAVDLTEDQKAFAQEVAAFLDGFDVFPATDSAHRIAAREAAAGRYSYWDAVLIVSAADFGCSILLSEDMHDGAKLAGVTVRNPFGSKGLSKVAREVLEPK